MKLRIFTGTGKSQPICPKHIVREADTHPFIWFKIIFFGKITLERLGIDGVPSSIYHIVFTIMFECRINEGGTTSILYDGMESLVGIINPPMNPGIVH